MEDITKKDIKLIKGMIGDREQEICIQEYKKCNDKNVRKVQENDPKLKAMEKAVKCMMAIKLLQDTSKETNQDIFDEAYKIYTDKGQDAVFVYANEKGLEYAYCSPCEIDSPSLEDTCLVCGTPNGDN